MHYSSMTMNAMQPIALKTIPRILVATRHSTIQGLHSRISTRHRLSRIETHRHGSIITNASSSPLPRVVLKGGKSRLFIDQQSPIVYSGAIDRVVGKPAPKIGDTVVVCNGKEESFAWGIYNPNSMYRVRIMQTVDECFGKDVTNPNLYSLIDSRIQNAISLRTDILRLSHTPSNSTTNTTNVWRMINSEGDRLSGLVADTMGNHVVVSSTAAWVEQQRDVIMSSIRKHAPWVDNITWRQGAELMAEEGWTSSSSSSSGGGDNNSTEGEQDTTIGTIGTDTIDDTATTSGGSTSSVIVQENNALFEVNPLGQKTGFYADQRDHRAFIRTLSHNKTVLDLCCYSGAFSIHAALGGASSTLGVDSSNAAIELAMKNAQLNNVDDICSFEKCDVTEFMKKAKERNQTWDIVILDPPKLAPNRKSLQKALRKYSSLNVLAMKLVKTGGVLMTCSCSGAVAADDDVFTEMVREAAQRAGRRVVLLRKGGAAACHGIDPGYVEGRYLTNCTYRVL